MATFNVSTSAELQSALTAATGGDTIVLAGGDYGSVIINARQYADYVTIRSADGETAVFDSLAILNSSFIRVDRVHVDNSSNGSASSRLVTVDGGSHHVEFLNSEANGLVDSDYSGWYGLHAGDASDVVFAGNYVHDIKNGIVVLGADNVVVRENTVDYIGADSMKFSGVNGVLIENNTGARHVFPLEGAHNDFIQFQGSSQNIVITGNVFLPETVFYSQGIFFGKQVYTNVSISDNIIYNALIRGISIVEGSGIEVFNNTVLTVPGFGHKASSIITPSGSVVHDNIMSHVASNSGPLGSNLVLQWDEPGSPYYYDDYYVNASRGFGITIEDLRPVAGTDAETKGAFARILELIDGAEPAPPPDPEPEPDPEPDPDPEPEPEPDPEPDEPVLLFSHGLSEFTGTIDDALIFPHEDAFMTIEGTLEMIFIADTVSGTQGLFSKDSMNFDDGGHLTILLNGDDILVRMQSDTADHTILAMNAVDPLVQTHFAFTFGDDGMQLYLDGALAGSNAYTGGLLGNAEPIVLGANQWASGDLVADNLIDPFDGLIREVNLFDAQMDAAGVGLLAGEWIL